MWTGDKAKSLPGAQPADAPTVTALIIIFLPTVSVSASGLGGKKKKSETLFLPLEEAREVPR